MLDICALKYGCQNDKLQESKDHWRKPNFVQDISIQGKKIVSIDDM